MMSFVVKNIISYRSDIRSVSESHRGIYKHDERAILLGNDNNAMPAADTGVMFPCRSDLWLTQN